MKKFLVIIKIEHAPSSHRPRIRSNVHQTNSGLILVAEDFNEPPRESATLLRPVKVDILPFRCLFFSGSECNVVLVVED
jgi:hypothetical protein